MARPIKETPVLRGKDAEIFLKKVKANENKKISAAEYQKAKRDYEEILKNARI